MTKTKKRGFGDLGEKVAEKYLKSKGYKILDRNFQNNSGRRLGEIDIVATDKKRNELVFVEVKTRDGKKYSETLPEENITPAKMRRMAKIAEVYIRQKKLENRDFRFDAVSVWLDQEEKKAKVKHIPCL